MAEAQRSLQSPHEPGGVKLARKAHCGDLSKEGQGAVFQESERLDINLKEITQHLKNDREKEN